MFFESCSALDSETREETKQCETGLKHCNLQNKGVDYEVILPIRSFVMPGSFAGRSGFASFVLASDHRQKAHCPVTCGSLSLEFARCFCCFCPGDLHTITRSKMMEKSLVGRDKHLILLTLPGDPTISRYPVTDSV